MYDPQFIAKVQFFPRSVELVESSIKHSPGGFSIGCGTKSFSTLCLRTVPSYRARALSCGRRVWGMGKLKTSPLAFENDLARARCRQYLDQGVR